MTDIVNTQSTATVTVATPTSAIVNVSGAATATVNQNQAVVTSQLTQVDSIGDPNWIQFNTSGTATSGIGRLTWDDTDQTLSLGLPTGVTLQIGQENLLYVVNKTDALIAEGAAVYVTGSQGQRTTIALADADSIDKAAHNTIGLVTSTGGIAKNALGYVTLNGLVRGLNTAAWAEGDVLWLSPVAGQLTNVEPEAPIHNVRIGWVVRSQLVNGSILVDVSVIPNLQDLDNVKITNPTDGQVLKYQASTGLWINGSI